MLKSYVKLFHLHWPICEKDNILKISRSFHIKCCWNDIFLNFFFFFFIRKKKQQLTSSWNYLSLILVDSSLANKENAKITVADWAQNCNLLVVGTWYSLLCSAFIPMLKIKIYFCLITGIFQRIHDNRYQLQWKIQWKVAGSCSR